MRIALAQMRVVPGEPERNTARMLEMIAQARAQECDIVAFPEMCVGGYLLSDRWTETAWCEYLETFNEKLREASDGIVVIYGNVYVDHGAVNRDGRVRKCNVAWVFHNGKPLPRSCPLPAGLAVKSLLPDYRVFDDHRYFCSLQDLAADFGVPLRELLVPFETTIRGQRVRFGVEICEDLWFKDYRANGAPLNISRMMIQNGAECIFNLSASPWTYGKDRARTNRIRESCDDIGSFVPFYYVNCVGVQNNGKNVIVFDGDSTVYDSHARVIAEAASPFAEELLVRDTEAAAKAFVKTAPERIEAKYRAIIEAIRGMDELMGNSSFPWIIGLSGGIDSSLVAALVHQAVGSARILACSLPSRYNSDTTRANATALAARLDTPLHTIAIEELTALNARILAQFSPKDIHHENIQAKIRGASILSNIAGITGGLMTNNGNKVEIALGYATLYGDINGALAPIGDLLKTEVFAMARYINETVFGTEIIPESLLPDESFNFAMPPSAELKNDQVDPMKWGYHDALVEYFTSFRKGSVEQIVEWYRDGALAQSLGIAPQLLSRYGLDKPSVFFEDLEWVVRSMQRAVFKRIQSPPIIILSRGSYGFDIRESQLPVWWSEKYKKMKREILGY